MRMFNLKFKIFNGERAPRLSFITNCKLKIRNSYAGFTMIELLLVIGIMVVLIGASGLSLGSINYGRRVENTTQQIVTLLRTAQQRSSSQEESTRWGVYLDNTDPAHPSFTLFTVVDADANNPAFIGQPGTTVQRSTLPGAIKFLSPADGTSARVIFERGTGLPATPVTIIIGTEGGTIASSTITAATNGRIDY